MWKILIGGIALVTGYLLGRWDRAFEERKQLQRIADKERKQQEAIFLELEESEKREAQDKKRRLLAQATRDALDFGYTLQQIIDWAYTEVFFEDFKLAPRKTQISSYGETEYCETQAEADNRRKQSRYVSL